MPHFGNSGALLPQDAAAATEARGGADILLSLTTARSSSSSDLNAPSKIAMETSSDGKEFFPLSPPTTALTEAEKARNGTRQPVFMAIHGSGYHRIAPSPITMEQDGHSLVYSNSVDSAEKRQAESSSPAEDGDDDDDEAAPRPRKQARVDAHELPSAPSHEEEPPQEPPSIKAVDSTLISPTASDEGRKTEQLAPSAMPTTPPRPPASYFSPHHHPQPPSHPLHHHPARYPPSYHPHHATSPYPPPLSATPSWGPPPGAPHSMPPHHYYYGTPPPPSSSYTHYPPHHPHHYPSYTAPGVPPPRHAPLPAAATPKGHHHHGSASGAGTGGSHNSHYVTPAHDGSGSTTGNLPANTPGRDAMAVKHAEAQSEAIQSIADWQKGGTARSYARCVPLQHPIPSRYWGETNKDVDRKLPDFPRLVNFPDYLSRGQIRNGEGGKLTMDGKRHCVMCGKLRVCSKSAQRKKTSSYEGEGNPGVGSDASTVHIIPRQNKGVCTACDVTVWVMVAQDGLEIKWCKGCKNFRPWAAFGDKGLATKCVRCRHRQREKYASQKSEMRRAHQEDDATE